jgi:hypothetical protein
MPETPTFGRYAEIPYDQMTPERIEAPLRDADWGERFFHITDADDHELRFAWPLKRG